MNNYLYVLTTLLRFLLQLKRLARRIWRKYKKLFKLFLLALLIYFSLSLASAVSWWYLKYFFPIGGNEVIRKCMMHLSSLWEVFPQTTRLFTYAIGLLL